MDTSNSHPEIEQLLSFIPLQALNQGQLEALSKAIEILEMPPGQTLIERGSNDNASYYLLEGELRLIAADGRQSKVQSGTGSAHSPLAQLRPRHYDVFTLTDIKYLHIDNELIDKISTETPTITGNSGVAGYEVSGDTEEASTEFEDTITSRFLADLESDELSLPSLPEVAVRIGRALQDNVSDADQIAQLIQTDPVITAKLIKAANSALYGRRVPVESCSGAVVRLGSDVTHKLVLSYALRDLFKSDSGLLQRRMKELWKHSTKVAAICYVLAKHDRRFNPEHAMLAGLLHDIGIVAVLNYARTFPFEALQPEVIDQAVRHLRAQVGGMILRKWGFAMDFIVAALEGEEWMRNQGPVPDYCDLVIVAQLHSFVGTEHALSVPAIQDVPALVRMGLGELGPRKSLAILEQADEQIKHAESMLNI